MPSDHYYREQIERELAGAEEALLTGNGGRARVCARRAVGEAIAWYLTKYPHPSWPVDAMRQLQALKDERAFPQDVRDAAARLTAKVTAQFAYASGSDALTDARRIIDYIASMMEKPNVG